EKFLIPVFAETLGYRLDHLGITVCSVAGTNFTPYVKFLSALGIPFAVITDWDPIAGKKPLGMNRAAQLVVLAEKTRTGETPEALINELEQISDGDEVRLSAKFGTFGVFTNNHTLEIDLLWNGFAKQIIETLQEHSFSADRKDWIEEWAADPDTLEVERFLTLIEAIGKGRFAQRLASRVGGMESPDYITNAIKFVANRV